MSSVKKRKTGGSKKKDDIDDNDKDDESKKTVSTKVKSSKKSSDKVSSPPPDDSGGQEVHPKFGPMPKLSTHRLWSRTALILGLMAVVWYNSNRKNESSLASVKEDVRYKGMKTKCSAGFSSHVKKFTGCVPNHCGRLVSDEVVTNEEVYGWEDLISRGFKEAKFESAVSILDFSSGLVKIGGRTLDVYKLNKTKPVFRREDNLVFQSTKGKLMRMVSSYFGIDYWSLHLAGPCFVSRITSRGPQHTPDEYWHLTIHQDIFESFDYTSVVFLSTYDKDFEGGRLIFVDGDNTNRTVEPRKGRAVAFTSGLENKHFTERVMGGERIMLLMGFTCDPKKAKKDPSL